MRTSICAQPLLIRAARPRAPLWRLPRFLRRAGLSCAIALLLPGQAWAQLAELRPGSRVRVEAPGELAGRVEATVLELGRDTLRIARPNGAPVPVPIASITWLAVNRGAGRRASAWTGAKREAIVGLGFGLLNVFFSDCGGRYCDTSYKAGGVAAVTAIGAAAGALIGASRRGDRWVRLALPPTAPPPTPATPPHGSAFAGQTRTEAHTTLLETRPTAPNGRRTGEPA